MRDTESMIREKKKSQREKRKDQERRETTGERRETRHENSSMRVKPEKRVTEKECIEKIFPTSGRDGKNFQRESGILLQKNALSSGNIAINDIICPVLTHPLDGSTMETRGSTAQTTCRGRITKRSFNASGSFP